MSAAAHSVDKNPGFFTKNLEAADPEVFTSIQDELNRQRDKIELIASENIVSKAVLEAQGSVLTNKYAEGYPGKRYYGGCEFVDVSEQLAIDRARRLFDAAFANVQPHSGANANQAVFYALLSPGSSSAMNAAMLALAPECGWTLANSAPNSSRARIRASSSASSTT